MQSDDVATPRVDAAGAHTWWTVDSQIEERLRLRLQSEGLNADTIASRKPEFEHLLASLDGVLDGVPAVARSIALLGLHDTLVSLQSGLEIPGFFDTSTPDTLQSRAAERLGRLTLPALRLLRRLAIDTLPVSLATVRGLTADFSDAPTGLLHELMEAGWLIRRDNDGRPSEYRVPYPLAMCVLRETSLPAFGEERAAWLEFNIGRVWTLEYGVQTPENADTLTWFKSRLPHIERLLQDSRYPLSARERFLGARFWLARFSVASSLDELTRSRAFVAQVESLTHDIGTSEATDLLVQAEAESICRAVRAGRIEEAAHALELLGQRVAADPSATRRVWRNFAEADFVVEDSKDLPRGLALLAQVVVDAQAVGLTMLAARANMNLGNFYFWLDRHDDAFEHYVRASVQARDVGAMRLEAIALVNQPISVDYARPSRADDRRRAIRAGHQAAQHFADLKDPFGVAMAHQSLGMAYCGVLQMTPALQHFQEAYERMTSQHDVRQRAFVMHNLTEISMFCGHIDKARTVNAQLQELAATHEDDITRFTAAMADFAIAFDAGQWAFAMKRAKDCITALENTESIRSRLGLARWWLACAQQQAGVENIELPEDAVPDSPMGATAQAYQALFHAIGDNDSHPLVQRVLGDWMKKLVTTLHEPELQRGLVDDCIGTPLWGALRRLVDVLPDARRWAAMDLVVANQRRPGHWLLLDVDRMAARYADGPWTSLQHRAKAFQLLRHLAVRHARQPEHRVTQDELIEWLWPGEKLVGDSGAGRLHSTFTQLRNLGFRDVIQRIDDGYGLARGTIAYLWQEGLPIDLMPA